MSAKTYIKAIYIDTFGGVTKRTVTLEKGINVISGKNGIGKSTLAAFIKFILYGMSGKVSGGISERARWTCLQSGVSAGAIELCHNGTDYRIERSVVLSKRAQGKETLKIIEMSSGEERFKGEVPGELFFSLNAETFEETVFTGQSDSSVDKKTVKNAIENMLSSGSESLSAEKALKRIDEVRVKLLYKNQSGGMIYDTDREIASLKSKLEEIKALYSEIKAAKDKLSELERSLSELDVLISKNESTRSREAALSVIQLFDEYEKAKAEYERIEKEYEELSLLSYNGFSPDNDYAMALYDVKFRLSRLDEKIGRNKGDIASLEQQLENIKDRSEYADKLFQGKGTLLQSAKRIKDGIKSSAITSVICAFFTVVWLLAALIIGGEDKGSIFYIMVTVSAIFGFSLIVVLLRLYRLYSEKNKILLCWGVEKLDMLSSAYDALNNKYSQYAEVIDNIKKQRDALAENESMYSEFEKKADELLSRWGRRYVDIEGLVLAYEAAKDFVNEKSRLDALRESARASYLQFARMIEGKSREDAEKALSQLKACELSDCELPEEYYGVDLKAERERLIAVRRTTELELARKEADIGNPYEIESELLLLSERRDALYKRYKALVLASEVLFTASQNLRNSIVPRLSGTVAEFVGEVTEGSMSVSVSSDISLSYREDEYASQKADVYMSAGTRDLSYVALRIALAEMLCNENTPFLIFDEVFSRFDNERLKRVFELLGRKSESFQFIILSSGERESELNRGGENCKNIYLE